jgi:excisionase family DNA binding protein
MTKRKPPRNTYLNQVEFAAAVGVSRETVYQWIKTSKLPVHSYGKRVLIHQDYVLVFRSRKPAITPKD